MLRGLNQPPSPENSKEELPRASTQSREIRTEKGCAQQEPEQMKQRICRLIERPVGDIQEDAEELNGLTAFEDRLSAHHNAIVRTVGTS